MACTFNHILGPQQAEIFVTSQSQRFLCNWHALQLHFQNQPYIVLHQNTKQSIFKTAATKHARCARAFKFPLLHQIPFPASPRQFLVPQPYLPLSPVKKVSLLDLLNSSVLPLFGCHFKRLKICLFSRLSLLSSNIQADLETSLRNFLTKRLEKMQPLEGSGNIISIPAGKVYDQNAMVYFYSMDEESSESLSDNSTDRQRYTISAYIFLIFI